MKWEHFPNFTSGRDLDFKKKTTTLSLNECKYCTQAYGLDLVWDQMSAQGQKSLTCLILWGHFAGPF